MLKYTLPVAIFSILVNIPKFLETQVKNNHRNRKLTISLTFSMQVSYSEEQGMVYNVTDLRLNPTYIWWYTLSYICHPLLTTTVGPFFVLAVLNYKIYRY